MPGAIPLLGGLFGGRNEGLFGITYRLFGRLDDPQLTMNPISALRLGFSGRFLSIDRGMGRSVCPFPAHRLVRSTG